MNKIMFKYTDKAKLFIYIFFRLVQNIVFVYVPINSARFIDSIVAKNYANSIKYGKLEILILIIYTSLFIINQYLENLIDIDIFEGFIRSLRRKVQLLKREDEPDSQTFNLILNQNFEIIKPFFYRFLLE